MQGGNFSGIANLIYDPASRVKNADGTVTATPFANNIIPSARIDKTSKQLLEFYPAANLVTSRLSNNFQKSCGTPHQQGPVHSAHGLPGILQILLVRPL